MKRKYIHLFPHNGAIPTIPLECHLDTLSVTLTQWCDRECMSTPSARAHPSYFCVFALDDDPLPPFQAYYHDHAPVLHGLFIGSMPPPWPMPSHTWHGTSTGAGQQVLTQSVPRVDSHATSLSSAILL
jgi:hypothetical protein